MNEAIREGKRPTSDSYSIVIREGCREMTRGVEGLCRHIGPLLYSDVELYIHTHTDQFDCHL